jgi:hypothetical protein
VLYFESCVSFCVIAHFCFDLVCKVIVKVQKEFYSSHLHELITWTVHKKQTFVSI